MMLCVNCPKKPMAFARVWGCVLMLLIAVILSFQPLITLQVGDSNTMSQMEDMLESVAGDDDDVAGEIQDFLDEFPDEVEVSAMDIVSCVGTIVDFLSAITSEDADSEAADSFADMFDNEEGRKTLMVVAAIAVGVTDSLDIKGMAEDVAEDLVKEAIKAEIGTHMDELRVEYAELNSGYMPSDEELYSMIEHQGLEQIYGENAEIFDELGIDVAVVEEAISEAREEAAGMESEEEDDLGENIFMMILNVMIVMICLLAVLGFTVVAPVIYIISALTALIPALIHVKDPDEAAAKVSRKLTGLITIPLSLILFQCVLPTMNYAGGTMALLIISLVCVLFNTVLSRLHSYTAPQMKYANIMQGVSLIGVAGYLVFFFNVINANIFNTFINGNLGKQLLNVMEASLEKEEVASNGYIVDIVMIVVAVVLVLSSTDYFKACLQRLSCSIPVGKNGSKIKDVQIVRAILMLPIYVLPYIVATSKNFHEDVTKAGEGDASLLIVSQETADAMMGVQIGIIMILVAEIALIVLKLVLCKDVSAEDMGDVMCGAANADFAPVEAPAEEGAPVEETAAEEEVPAEEETPAEEEAPAEEAVPAEGDASDEEETTEA